MEITKQLTQNWDQTKSRLKEQYSNLNEEDLRLESGREHELIERLQTKLGKRKEEVEQILDEATY